MGNGSALHQAAPLTVCTGTYNFPRAADTQSSAPHTSARSSHALQHHWHVPRDMEKGSSETHHIFLTSRATQGTHNFPVTFHKGSSAPLASPLTHLTLPCRWKSQSRRAQELHHIPHLCLFSCLAMAASGLEQGHRKRCARPTHLQGYLLGAPWRLTPPALGKGSSRPPTTSLTSHFLSRSKFNVPLPVHRGRSTPPSHSAASGNRAMPEAMGKGSLAQARSTTCQRLLRELQIHMVRTQTQGRLARTSQRLPVWC